MVGLGVHALQGLTRRYAQVRATWASEISKSGWGKPIRASIHLRRTLAREPSREEVENELGAFKNVSRDDVREALDSGEEVSALV